MKNKYILFLALGCLPLWSLYAQLITDWTAYHQLSQVNDWAEDEQTIYLASDVGVFLIDKETKAVVDHWTRASNGLPSNRVEAIGFHPTTQSMYIGTYDIGIGFQASDGHWETMPYPDEIYTPGWQMLTYCLEFDNQNRLVVGTSRGALRWEGEEWTIFNQETLGISFFQGVWEMEQMEDGTLFLGGNVTLKSAGESFEIATPLDTFGTPVLFSYSDTRLHLDPSGDLIVITDLGELGRYDGTEWEILSSFSGTSDISFHNAEFLFEDEEETTWVYLGWQGYAKYVDGAWSIVEVGPLPLDEPRLIQFDGETWYGIAADSFYVFDQDELLGMRLGNMPWENALFRLHTDQSGQLWTRSAANKLTALETGETITIEVDGEAIYIYDFLFDQLNELWISSGYNFYHFAEDGTVNTYSSENSILPQEIFRHLVVDGLNRIWAWSYNEGMYLFQDGEWQAIEMPDGSIAEMFAHPLSSGVYTVSYSSFNGIRLALQTPSTHEWIDFPASWDNLGFATFGVNPENGDLWLASSGDELARKDESGEWELIHFPEEWVPDDFVRKLRTHANGIWIMGQYQFAFRNLDGQWFYYNQENLPLDTDRMMDADLDADGTFWVLHSIAKVVEAFETSWVTSTDDLPELENLAWSTVYPNPAKDMLYPQWEGLGETLILDQNGRFITSLDQQEASAGVPLTHLPAGNYYLLWKGEDETRVAKFIKL